MVYQNRLELDFSSKNEKQTIYFKHREKDPSKKRDNGVIKKNQTEERKRKKLNICYTKSGDKTNGTQNLAKPLKHGT